MGDVTKATVVLYVSYTVYFPDIYFLYIRQFIPITDTTSFPVWLHPIMLFLC